MYSKKAKKTALIVVDMLKCLTVEGGYNYYPTAKEMIEDGYDDKIRQMRDHGCLVVWVGSALQHRSGYTATPHEINPELAGRSLAGEQDEASNEFDDRLWIDEARDVIVRKHTYSAFWGTPLLSILQQNGVQNVLACGIKTNVCCRQTLVDSVSHGFRTYLIKDMTSTNNEEIKAYHLEEINRYFAKVLDADEAVTRFRNGEF